MNLQRRKAQIRFLFWLFWLNCAAEIRRFKRERSGRGGELVFAVSSSGEKRFFSGTPWKWVEEVRGPGSHG